LAHYRQVLDALAPKQRRAERNIRACCRLLGASRSRQAFQQRLGLLESLATDSPVLADLAWSLGRTGEARAVKPLRALLGKYIELGRQFLRTRAQVPPPYVPYDDQAAAQVVEALAEMHATEAAAAVIELARMKESGGRLYLPVMSALRAMPSFRTPRDAEKTEAAFVEIIGDEAAPMAVRYVAIREAVAQNRAKALPAIRKILDARPERRMIAAAAWAIWKFTGQAPAIPDPRPAQGDWLVQTREK
jgi:HEAT repeat protein